MILSFTPEVNSQLSQLSSHDFVEYQEQQRLVLGLRKKPERFVFLFVENNQYQRNIPINTVGVKKKSLHKIPQFNITHLISLQQSLNNINAQCGGYMYTNSGGKFTLKFIPASLKM